MAIVEKAKSSKVKIRNNKNKSFLVYGVVVALFLIGLVTVIMYVNAYKKEVAVLSFNQNMVDRTLVEESFMARKTVSEKNFEPGMVKWDDREQYIGTYVAHFVRSNVAVYDDMFTEEQALRTSYLYSLEGDEELLTFPYDISTAGGKLVTPGDRLRIRGSYAVGEENEDKDVKSEIIFDVVEVQDLLNSNNESIVDIITDANRLPQKDREALMTSEEFLGKVTPKAILMVVKTKDLSKYVEFKSKENPIYTITMLTRNEELKSNELNTGNSLLQLLQQVQSEGATPVAE